jgi:hypothetical protein
MHDLYNTMFWPTIILLLGRFMFPRAKESDAKTDRSGDFADQPFKQSAAV